MTENKRAKSVAAFLAAMMLCACLLPAALPLIQRIITEKAERQLRTGDADGKPRAVLLREGDYIQFGAYQEEPLLWQVIGTDEGGRPQLLADAVICFKAFDVPSASSAAESADTAAYGSADWNSCSLKRWLNSDDETAKDYGENGFLSNGNFTAAQRESIDEPGVFLPSRAELKNVSKHVSLKKHCCSGATHSCSYLVLPSQAVWYWTRTPNTVSRVSVVTVTSSGGFYKTVANDPNTGVCPAFFFNAPIVTATGGDGSESAPYFVVKGGADA